jgi:RNA polymerase sigma-70 factor (sigma-E family)
VPRKSALAVYETVAPGVHVPMNEEGMPLTLPRRLEAIEGVGFEAFFRDQHSRLLGSMRLITGNSHEAEELVQEAFFKVWERWDRVGTMGDPTGYLYRTAMNAHRSAYRRTIRAAKRVFSPPAQSDPFVAVAARDAVLRALGALTPRQRAAMVLTELQGLRTEEAAEMLGIRPGTVRVLVSKGRAALRSSAGSDDE